MEKFTNLRFEPAGMTDDPEIRIAQSMMDYIFRRLAVDHWPYDTRASLGIFTTTERVAQLDADGSGEETTIPGDVVPAAEATRSVHSSAELLQDQQGLILDAPLCMSCGTTMRPSVSCYVCESCGSTSGCS